MSLADPAPLRAASRPVLSVVMPVLNEATGIRASLEAMAPLRAAGVELIIVDGGSRDGTPALCQGWADRVLKSPAGRARQMNAGAAAATGDLLLFLHADTRLPDRALELVQAATAEGGQGPVGRAWGRFDVQIEGRSAWLPLVARLMNLRSRLSGIATGDQALFMRRAAFDAVGGFPEQPLMEDIEISRRLMQHPAAGAPACLHARVTTSGRRWDERGALRTIVLMWCLRLLYRLGVGPERLARAYR